MEPVTSEPTINQRLKFLIENLSNSVREFSEAIGDSYSNTQNYVGTRQLAPKHEYIAKVLIHFSNVNAYWLITGQGEPFLTHPLIMKNENNASVKKTKGNVQANSGQTVNNISLDNCQQDLQICRAKLTSAENEIKLLRDQLALQASLVAAKDDTISILRNQLTTNS